LIRIKATAARPRQSVGMDAAALIEKYDRRVPRYTSYPTAPHFTPAVDGVTYGHWLADLASDAPISLYLHVPFCDQLCLFCGCHTTVVRRDAPKESYAALVQSEIALLARHIGRRQKVGHIHWGGGTPTALPAAMLLAIAAALRAHFEVAGDAEIAVEIDPRNLPADRIAALAEIGVTRASLGVQDFDPMVQQVIGRVQSFTTTAECAERLRGIGVRSINLDLIYGLPFQTPASVAETVERTLALEPERVAVFGYAHVPWMKRHQRLLPEKALPDPAARFAQRTAVDAVLRAAGFVPIGLDHYARPDDRLAQAAVDGSVRRNFQGYTTDDAPVLLGFGASAIGSLPQGYVQNAAKVPDYAAALKSGMLPTARGVAVSAEDRLRRAVIEALMCRLAADLPAIAAAHAGDVEALAPEGELREMGADGLVRWDGRLLQVTEFGRPFVRSIAAVFDAYLQPGAVRHTAAV
jgi:oxygen-independent coproporphyrinogen III oxidase